MQTGVQIRTQEVEPRWVLGEQRPKRKGGDRKTSSGVNLGKSTTGTERQLNSQKG